jgi:hypothetical protein
MPFGGESQWLEGEILVNNAKIFGYGSVYLILERKDPWKR